MPDEHPPVGSLTCYACDVCLAWCIHKDFIKISLIRFTIMEVNLTKSYLVFVNKIAKVVESSRYALSMISFILFNLGFSMDSLKHKSSRCAKSSVKIKNNKFTLAHLHQSHKPCAIGAIPSKTYRSVWHSTIIIIFP